MSKKVCTQRRLFMKDCGKCLRVPNTTKGDNSWGPMHNRFIVLFNFLSFALLLDRFIALFNFLLFMLLHNRFTVLFNFAANKQKGTYESQLQPNSYTN